MHKNQIKAKLRVGRKVLPNFRWAHGARWSRTEHCPFKLDRSKHEKQILLLLQKQMLLKSGRKRKTNTERKSGKHTMKDKNYSKNIQPAYFFKTKKLNFYFNWSRIDKLKLPMKHHNSSPQKKTSILTVRHWTYLET